MPATPAQRRQGAIDLNQKLQLEASLRSSLETLDRVTARSVARSLGTRGVLPDVRGDVVERLTPILAEHYNKVVDVFGSSTSNQLEDDLFPSEEEIAAIAAALGLLVQERAPAQASIIATTTERDARRSIEIARDLSTQQLLGGTPPPSPQEEAVVAGAILFRSLARRRGTIVMAETQTVAEAAKQTETEVLVGAEPTVNKTWVTRGDSLVREHHADADGQSVRVDRPYLVRGEELMHPGDASLGAQPDNVINCRCSSVFDVDAIRSARS